jgi:hypothetical protein
LREQIGILMPHLLKDRSNAVKKTTKKP